MEFRSVGDGTNKLDAVMGIDIDGDGKINPDEKGDEKYSLYENFQIGQRTFRIVEVDPYLPRVVFKEVLLRSDETPAVQVEGEVDPF